MDFEILLFLLVGLIISFWIFGVLYEIFIGGEKRRKAELKKKNDIYKKDENDGKDELIVTVDNYAIVDDELKYIIDTYLKENVTLIALFDNCHSGTILDLPYQYFKGDEEMIHHSLSTDTKGTVICLSGCRDDQVSMDAYLEGDFNGAMTYNFIKLMKENESLSWKACVEQLREKLQAGNFNQVPQITCGRQMDLNTLSVKL